MLEIFFLFVVYIQNVEKGKEESEQSQWREVVRLREEVSRSRKELHHKDEKIKELESGIKQGEMSGT